jgi:hypothetical protein
VKAPNYPTATYSDLYEHVEAVVTAAQAGAQSARSNPLLSPEGKRDMMRSMDQRNGWSAALDSVAAELTGRVTAAEAARDKALTPKALAVDATAAELRAARYWNRTRPLLDLEDNAAKLFPAVMQLVETVDDADLATVLEELPAYLQARGVDAGDLVTEALFRRVPAAAEHNRDALHAQTMRNAVFAPMLGYAREVVDAHDGPTVPSGVVLKLGAVEEIEARHLTQRAGRTGAAS